MGTLDRAELQILAMQHAEAVAASASDEQLSNTLDRLAIVDAQVRDKVGQSRSTAIGHATGKEPQNHHNRA